jgi:hypothetical protein
LQASQSSLKLRFNLEFEHCPNRSGKLNGIAAMLERPAIEKMLTPFGLEARAPPRSPAGGQMPLQDI